MLIGAIIVLFLNSILRGIKVPDRYACQHLLYNYDFGFTRRGLIGTVLEALHVPSFCHYNFCFWVNIPIAFANIVLLTTLAVRVLAAKDSATRVAGLLFGSSLAVVFLASTVGYMDHLWLLFTLLVLRVDEFYPRLVMAGIGVPLLILTQETGFVTLFPVICMRFLLDVVDKYDSRRMAALCIMIGIAVSITALIGRFHLTDAQAVAMYHSLQAMADYPLRKDSFVEHTWTSYDRVLMALPVWTVPMYRRVFLLVTLVTFPTTLYFMYRSSKELLARRYGAVVRWAALMTGMSPLFLNFTGGDIPRWASLATTASFLVLAICTSYSRRTTSANGLPHHGHLVVSGALIALNLGSSISLFGGYTIKNFPYEGHIDNVRRILTGSESFPPRPPSCEEVGCVAVVGYSCTAESISVDKLTALDEGFAEHCGESGSEEGRPPLELDRRWRQFMEKE
jgi:hypothetical protein